MDDAYALALLLACPGLGLRAVLTNSGHVQRRARLARALLAAAGRADVPVFAGLDGRGVRGFNHHDILPLDPTPAPGPAAALRHLRTLLREGPLTWISIGGTANLAAALRALGPPERARLSVQLMGGSLARDYAGRRAAGLEDNLARDPRSARRVFTRAARLDVVPLDATWRLCLGAEERARIEAEHPLGPALAAAHARWKAAYGWSAPVLHDPLTIALLVQPRLAAWRELPLEVHPRGWLRCAPPAPRRRVAVAVRAAGVVEWLVRRLLEPAAPESQVVR